MQNAFVRTLLSAGVCVLAVAALIASGAAASELDASSIAGRWTGASYWEKGHGILTLDIAKCGAGWCGVKVEVGETCGAVALRVGARAVDENSARFEGSLALAAGTEPYQVHVAIFPLNDDGRPQMQITGDTGGEYRAYRRSFPFEAALARVQDPVCHAPRDVSSLR